ncbi:MAG: DUF1800 domain-containing protein [Burkholderiaceae bacterium]
MNQQANTPNASIEAMRFRARSAMLGATAISAAIAFSFVAAQSIAADRQDVSARDGNEALVAHVLNRVAYGPRPGDVERVRRIGVDAYIDEQLTPERIVVSDTLQQRLATLDVQRLPAGTLIDGYRTEQRAVREAQRLQAANGGDAKPADIDPKNGIDGTRRAQYRRLGLQAAEARLVQAIESPRQLQEVMTDFWFNHFNVFIGKDLDRALVANYERDAIRPYALGHFRDLLGATARHPAMLFYLDNWLSTGADAVVNRNAKQKAGLNENYAREVMELHTLGVENEGKTGGYTQKDVTELARMLTGWTFDGRATGAGGPLEGVESQALFIFAPRRHDNGTKVWLGHTVSANGEQEGEYALDVLAMHPATARHISFELAQYFVADEPPQALVDRLTARYLATDGDIREVMRTLLYSPEFRSREAMTAKFKTPYQYVVSAARASGVPIVNVQPLVGTLAQLGMPLYGCLTPDGYKNTEAAWLNPEGMARRINFVTALASGRLAIDRPAPVRVAAPAVVAMQVSAPAAPVAHAPMRVAPLQAVSLLETLGPTIGDRTRSVVLGTEPQLAAALVLGSPDFMRR